MRYIVFLIFFGLSSAWGASHHPTAFLERIKNTPDEGDQIIQHFCGTCHASKPLIPLGAPKPKVSQDWLPRLEQGPDVLFKHTNEGLRAMPPRGGCFECTDAQLWLAIKALLPEDALDKLKKN
ncbi:MAG: c-type cytochrome [Gammaproteobacteria bacterium]|nr:c-type cytochrome [Gammaproteobacteria bacterium]